MADKKISELDLVLQINNDAVFPMSQNNGGEPTSFKTTITQLGTEIAEDMTYSNLQTTSKNLVGAINELLSLGSPIIIGTTAPTSSIGEDGNIYVQYTAGTGGADDEVDGIYVKIDGAWCEISTGGGGGSGGHTILDDEGTSLTQRDDLQFKGAYSEDDSTNDKTVVNVARTMTLAEFEQLTDDEKAGFINVADETSGSDDKFQPLIYSEEEREIGVWTDGKPLYQKTYEIDVSTLVAVSDWTTIDSTINGETMAGMEISVKNKTDYSSRFIAFRTDYVDPIPRFTIIQGAFKYFTDSSTFPYNNYVWTITIRYTKTTDQAGSGQWTPQGVPTVHYSTDEQIVGTWIDGSTLYERTLTTPTTSTTTASGISSVFSLSGVENVEIVGGYVYIGTATLPLNFVMYEVNYSVFTFYDIANAQIANNVIGWTPTAFNIRVRYTKSST